LRNVNTWVRTRIVWSRKKTGKILDHGELLEFVEGSDFFIEIVESLGGLTGDFWRHDGYFGYCGFIYILYLAFLNHGFGDLS
jgi:hypothetical protein